MLRRCGGTVGRDDPRPACVRTLADRRPVGRRARPGARRGDGDLGGARARAAARDPREAAVAREPADRRVQVADGVLVAIERWRATAPRIADEIAEEWGLTLGEPYVPGFCGHVVRATTADGSPAVLKVFFPDRESFQEPDALERWDGDGAIRLLRRDD